MPSITITYDELTATAVRKEPCPQCGRKTTRQRTFRMTVSPFNKNSVGKIRTYQEVQEAVDDLAAKWKPEPGLFLHSKCWRNR